MADPVGIQVTGLREVRRGLRTLSADLPKELTRIHRAAADAVANHARRRTPRRSGRLAGTVKPQAGQSYARVAAGRKAVPYAGPIHFGWPARNIAPQPFLTDTIHEYAPRILDGYLKDLTDLMAEAVNAD